MKGFHGKMYKKTIALDFDAVIHQYTGWSNGKLNGPIEGAFAAIRTLQEIGFDVVIFSTRDSEDIRSWLLQYDGPTIAVTREKPLCTVLVDDRAIRFDGIWTPELLYQITEFKAYWEK